jgi:hypothetical protein
MAEVAAQPGEKRAAVRALAADRWLLGAVGLWIGAGALLALATTQVKDWFVMTDELLYERLGISVAQSGSPFPRVHGTAIGNLNQLYPVLISPLFGSGDVKGALAAAHVLNAFVMTSAAVPAYLIARRVLGSGPWALGAAALSVALPWIVLASFLLTEVVAYPASLWAAWAMARAVERKTLRADVLALVLIAVAVLARTQLIVLAAAFPIAIVADAWIVGGRRSALGLWRTRRPLVALYGAGLVLVLVLAAAGKASSLLGNYAETAKGGVIQWRLLESFAQHAAVLALTMAIVPFLLGVAWLQRALRRERPANERAFAAVALASVVLILLEAASFDLRFGGGLVKDRYAFYAVPLLVVAALAAFRDATWPRLALVAPLVVVLAGFATLPVAAYEKLNVDSPAAALNTPLLSWTGSTGWEKVALVAATFVLLALFGQAASLVSRRTLGIGLAVVLAVVLPAQMAYGFDRLFRVNGTSGQPLTQSQAFVYDWVDKQLGSSKRVTMIPYPSLAQDFFASVGLWWSMEFWNKDVSQSATVDDAFAWTPTSFPKLALRFDPATGKASRDGEDFILASQYDARFRLAGAQQAAPGDLVLIAPEKPWRALWLTRGLTDDGWTQPGRPAFVRIYAQPGQKEPLTRSLTLTLESLAAGKALLRSNIADAQAQLAKGDTTATVAVCVPATGYADVRLTSPVAVTGPGDLRDATAKSIPRRVGVLVHRVDLADEATPRGPCPR